MEVNLGDQLDQPNKKKYLIVEDDVTLQPIWENIIRSIDPDSVIRWSKSEEGAEKLIIDRQKSGDKFDFIIADIMLSGEKNGIELWNKYKNTNMKFLFTSGLSEKQFARLFRIHSASLPLFVRKPLRVKECIESIKFLLK